MWLLRLLLRLRYSIRIDGAVDRSTRPLIVFGSLSSQIDPLLIAAYLPCKARFFHPENIVTMQWLSFIYRFLGWSPLPLWERKQSSFALRRFSRKLAEIKQSLRPKKASLFFLSGCLQQQPSALVPEKSLEEEVLADLSPPPRIIYAEVRGMLGSLFSDRTFGGMQAGHLKMSQIVCMLLKSAIFFMPKRKVLIHFSDEKMAPAKQTVQWVPHFRGEKAAFQEEKQILDLIFEKIATLVKKKREEIRIEQSLYQDLMLDSLDVTELTVWIREVFDRYASFESLLTVGDVVRAITNPYRPVDRAAVDERHLAAWLKERKKEHAPRPPMGQTIPAAFLSVCDAFGSEIACVDPMTIMSYKRMKSAVVGLAEPMRLLPGQYIGVLLTPSLQFNVLIHALILAGKVPLPLNWTLGPRHIEEVVKQTNLQVILSDDRFLEHSRIELPQYIEEKIQLVDEILQKLTPEEKHIALERARSGADAILNHFGKAAPQSTALLVFTSGTENRPKGVPLSHQNILANLSSLFAALDINESDSILGILPPFHIYGFSFGNLLPVLIGCRAVFMPRFLDFESVAHAIQQYRATIVPTVPTFLKALLQACPSGNLQSVRLFCVGAEPAPDSLFEAVEQLPHHPKLIEGYGITECSPCLTLTPLHGERKGVGIPLPGVELLIVHPETHQPLPQGRSGLVLAHGENVFNGYLGGRPNPFIQIDGRKWFKTNDLGHLEKDGSLILEGRLSRTVKIGGELIHLQALEEIIQKQVPKSALAIVADEREEKVHLILFIDRPLNLETANRYLKEAGLSNLLRLHEVRYLAQLPHLGNGKIDYRSLK
jgi:acyl carrier protein